MTLQIPIDSITVNGMLRQVDDEHVAKLRVLIEKGVIKAADVVPMVMQTDDDK